MIPRNLTKGFQTILTTGLAALILLVVPGRLWAAPTDTTAAAADTTGPPRLESVQLGTYPSYSRLIFNFNKPVVAYEVRRPDVDELWLIFDRTNMPRAGRYDMRDNRTRVIHKRA